MRPWFYSRNDVSYPAFRNERIVFEITDSAMRPWYLALVGGFGVGTIDLNESILQNTKVLVGQEIARFNLGSTVCIASPEQIEIRDYLLKVHVGESIQIKGMTRNV